VQSGTEDPLPWTKPAFPEAHCWLPSPVPDAVINDVALADWAHWAELGGQDTTNSTPASLATWRCWHRLLQNQSYSAAFYKQAVQRYQ
jgi:hypothetical protein